MWASAASLLAAEPAKSALVLRSSIDWGQLVRLKIGCPFPPLDKEGASSEDDEEGAGSRQLAAQSAVILHVNRIIEKIEAAVPELGSIAVMHWQPCGAQLQEARSGAAITLQLVCQKVGLASKSSTRVAHVRPLHARPHAVGRREAGGVRRTCAHALTAR